MPTYSLLDKSEKATINIIRQGVKPLTPEDHEKILEKAYTMYTKWQRGVRGQVIMPQDGLDYWVAVATYEYTLDRLGIKIDQ